VEELANRLFEEVFGANWIPENDHQKDTPKRFIKALKELATPEPFDFTTFPNTGSGSEMVYVGPIKFYSLCAHHILPFFGDVHLAYVPTATVAGLSKLARTVKWWQKGLWVQEELTSEIAAFLERQLNPMGVAVMMRAEHLCMTMRGVREPGAQTVTSEMRGCFLDPAKQARAEFFGIVNGSR